MIFKSCIVCSNMKLLKFFKIVLSPIWFFRCLNLIKSNLNPNKNRFFKYIPVVLVFRLQLERQFFFIAATGFSAAFYKILTNFKSSTRSTQNLCRNIIYLSGSGFSSSFGWFLNRWCSRGWWFSWSSSIWFSCFLLNGTEIINKYKMNLLIIEIVWSR